MTSIAQDPSFLTFSHFFSWETICVLKLHILMVWYDSYMFAVYQFHINGSIPFSECLLLTCIGLQRVKNSWGFILVLPSFISTKWLWHISCDDFLTLYYETGLWDIWYKPFVSIHLHCYQRRLWLPCAKMNSLGDMAMECNISHENRTNMSASLIWDIILGFDTTTRSRDASHQSRALMRYLAQSCPGNNSWFSHL